MDLSCQVFYLIPDVVARHRCPLYLIQGPFILVSPSFLYFDKVILFLGCAATDLLSLVLIQGLLGIYLMLLRRTFFSSSLRFFNHAGPFER